MYSKPGATAALGKGKKLYRTCMHCKELAYNALAPLYPPHAADRCTSDRCKSDRSMTDRCTSHASRAGPVKKRMKFPKALAPPLQPLRTCKQIGSADPDTTLHNKNKQGTKKKLTFFPTQSRRDIREHSKAPT